jgi:hypothetical protein
LPRGAGGQAQSTCEPRAAAAQQMVIVSLGPSRLPYRMAGKLVERLA